MIHFTVLVAIFRFLADDLAGISATYHIKS